MKFILSMLSIAFFSSVGYSNITADNEYLLNHAGSVQQKTQLGTLVNKTPNMLIGKYSYAVQGGTTVSSLYLLTSLADRKSYAQLPTGAIIKNAWIDCPTQLASSSSITTEITAQTTGDILGSTSTKLVGFWQGVPTGATTTFIKLTAARKLVIKFGTTSLTGGVCNVYVDYVQ